MTMNPEQSDPNAALRREMLDIFGAAVKAVDSALLIERALDGAIPGCGGLAHEIAAASRVFVLSIGKGAAAMAAALNCRLGANIFAGIAVVPDSTPQPGRVGPIEVLAGGHPLPTAESERAARAALAMLESTRDRDLVLVAISGGASAMFAAPAVGVTIEDKIAITSALLKSGATINELNTVRKHLSRVKGGRLAIAARSARVISLVLSDVPGNDLGTIGSGPTVADPTTYSDAISALKRRRVWGRAPERVRDHLERGAAGDFAETPKPGNPALARSTAHLIGDNSTALEAAQRFARERGWSVERWEELSGEGEKLGRSLADRLASIDSSRVCVLAGGEPVVTVRGAGRGGRAQQTALAIALELDRVAHGRKIAAMVAGTDGVDGPTDAAGGFAFTDTVARAGVLGFDAQAALRANDAYNLLKSVGNLALTGPTGTNVTDIFIGLANY